MGQERMLRAPNPLGAVVQRYRLRQCELRSPPYCTGPIGRAYPNTVCVLCEEACHDTSMMISEPHPVSYPVDVSGVHPTVLRRVPIDHATSGTILQRANRSGGLYGFAQTLRMNAL